MARTKPGMTRPHLIPAGPGRESVWDYPRPPDLAPSSRHVLVEWNGRRLAETTRAMRVRETSHPPTWGIPPGDVDFAVLRPNTTRTVCEWKGVASYWDLVDGTARVNAAAWTYVNPVPAYQAIAGYVFFYPGRVDRCLVDGIAVLPQPGQFYGGWVTPDVVGPFKGEPGSSGW